MKEKRNLPTQENHLGGGYLENNKKPDGRKKRILLVSIISMVVLLIGVSYAYIGYTTKQEGINVIQTDCINVELEEITNALELRNAYPITDEEGSKSKPYRFKLTNTCGVGVDYSIHLEVLESERRIESRNIAIKVDEEEKKIVIENEKVEPLYGGVESYEIGRSKLKAGESVIHDVRMWLDKSAGNETQNGSFQSKIVIEAIQNQITTYSESLLNGADPVLADNLIPIKIDDTGKVTKAKTSEEWYSYENKRWANAVILEDETKTYQEGEEIPESEIESYFVWIPKYSYQLWDLGEYNGLTTIDESKVHEIPIKFGLKNTDNANEGECTTPGISGASGNCQIGDYMTHPAFLAFGTNGLWVGKFESGYKGATSTAGAQVNSAESNKLQIKPNVYSWRGIQVANAHQVSYNYKRELDSHMMKNTEWGAVAYLQHSAYGSATSVRINNNSSYITGYASINEPTCGWTNTNEACNRYETTSLGEDGSATINYFNSASQVASTTGNYTGIYDMSGGNWECMMAVMLDSTNTTPLSGRNSTYNSGFNGPYGRGGSHIGGIDFPESKYYDTYNYDTSHTTYNRRILGDATGEMGPFGTEKYGNKTRYISSWYKNEANNLYIDFTWFVRSGQNQYGTGSGIFSFSDYAGEASEYFGFRTVLSV